MSLENTNRGPIATRRLRTVADLAGYQPDQWRDWFWDGISQWTSVPDDRLDLVDEVRRRHAFDVKFSAFSPIPLSPTVGDPPGALRGLLREVLGQRLAAPARGLTLMLEDWRISTEGAAGAAFGIRLASGLGSPGLGPALIGLFSRPFSAEAKEAENLVRAALDAIKDRCTPREGLRILKLLSMIGPLPPIPTVRILPRLADQSAAKLAGLLAEYAPAVVKGEEPSAMKVLMRAIMSLPDDWRRPSKRRPFGAPVGYDEAFELVVSVVGGKPTPDPIVVPRQMVEVLNLADKEFAASLTKTLKESVLVIFNKAGSLAHPRRAPGR